MSYGAALVGSDFGRGTAYRAELPFHRLNVLAGRMSAFPDRADDLSTGWRKMGSLTIPCCSPYAVTMVFIFVTGWLACLEIGSNEPGWTSLRPRLRPVGRMARADFRSHLKMVSSCTRRMSYCVSVSALRVCQCKLSQGKKRGPQHIIDHCWQPGWLSKIKAGDRICILGSGLTMIDQVLTLRGKRHQGSIHVLSRRGLVSHPHVSPPSPSAEPNLPEGSMEISGLLHSLRNRCAMGRRGVPSWMACGRKLNHFGNVLHRRSVAGSFGMPCRGGISTGTVLHLKCLPLSGRCRQMAFLNFMRVTFAPLKKRRRGSPCVTAAGIRRY